MIRFAAVTLACAMSVFGASAAAQECADWSATMPVPESLPQLSGTVGIAVDGLLVTAGDSLLVYSLDKPDLPILGRFDLPDLGIRRIREVDGEVFIACGSDGLWYANLTDPSQPICHAIIDDGSDIRDLAGFDGGVVVLAQTGDFKIFDGLGEATGELLGEGALGSGATVVAASGATACFNSFGVVTVDLSDPAMPVVGGHTYCDEHPYGPPEVSDIAILDGYAYSNSSSYYPYSGTGEKYLQKIDISDFEAPQPVVCREVIDTYTGFVVRDDHLVVCSNRTVAFLAPGDLQTIAEIMIPADLDHRTNLAIGDNDVIVVDPDAGVWRISPDPLHTINPIAVQSPRYAYGGGGRFGISIWGSRGIYGDGHHEVAISDQADLLDPNVIFEEEIDFGDNISYTSRLVSQTNRWAVLATTRSVSDPDYSYVSTGLRAFDIDGVAYNLAGAEYCRTHLDGRTLWISSSHMYADATIQAVGLWDTQPVIYPEQTVALSGLPYVLGDWLLILHYWTVDVYDKSNLGAVTPLDEINLESNTYLSGAPPIDDGGLLFVPMNTGIEILLATDDPEEPIRALGSVDLGADSRVSALALQDELLAVGYRDGWGVIDVSDPDQPSIICQVTGEPADGFVWFDHHLYVSHNGTIYLYNLGNPALPEWVGQSSGTGWTRPGIATRDQVLLANHRVLPLDCVDVVAIDGGDEPTLPDLPAAVVLYPVTPNPFNPSTAVRFDLTRSEHIDVSIHDLRGRRIARIADAVFGPGRHTVVWRGNDERGQALASGTYIIRLTTESAARTTKAVLIR